MFDVQYVHLDVIKRFVVRWTVQNAIWCSSKCCTSMDRVTTCGEAVPLGETTLRVMSTLTVMKPTWAKWFLSHGWSSSSMRSSLSKVICSGSLCAFASRNIRLFLIIVLLICKIFYHINRRVHYHVWFIWLKFKILVFSYWDIKFGFH